MKKFIVILAAAMFLAAPAATSAQNNTPVRKEQKKESDLKTVTFLSDMSCKKCKSKLEENISYMKGVEDLTISLEAQKITVKYNSKKTSEEKIAKVIRDLGYKAEKVSD